MTARQSISLLQHTAICVAAAGLDRRLMSETGSGSLDRHKNSTHDIGDTRVLYLANRGHFRAAVAVIGHNYSPVIQGMPA